MRSNNGRARRGRRLACSALLLAAAALALPAVAAAKTPPPPTQTYLALGDSFAFGYSTQLYNEGANKSDPVSGFEHGYVNAYLKDLKSRTTQLANDGCPEETTESFIGKNPQLLEKLNKTLKSAQEKNKDPEASGTESEPDAHKLPDCEYQEIYNLLKIPGKGGPLHHSYVGESQLENAIKTIKEEASKGTPVTLVTLDIGTFDILHVLAKTESEVRKEIEEKVLAAVIVKEPEFAELVAAAAKKRIEKDLLAERPNIVKECEAASHSEAEVAKCIEAASLPYVLKDATEHNYQKETEELVAAGAAQYLKEHGFELHAEGEKKAVEKIKGELHTILGQINSNLMGILIAIREAGTLELGGINYTGKIFFQSSYDPYGKQFEFAEEGVHFVDEHGGPEGPYEVDNGRCQEHAATEAEENEHITKGHCLAAPLHIGFNLVMALLNSYTYETAYEMFGACDTDPNVTWNIDNQRKPNEEPERMRAWTNMTNAEETEGKLDGPDVDPTPAGYTQLAAEFVKEAKLCHTQDLEHPETGPFGF